MTKINSSTFRFQICPLGAGYKNCRQTQFQWFVGAPFKPTYVLFGNATLFRADSRNYVYDSKIFAGKWNLNAGIEHS